MQQDWKFGLRQVFKTTPDFAKWIFRVVLYITTMLSIVVNVIPEIPEPIRAAITKYSLYAVTLVHSFSKLFGIEVKPIFLKPSKNVTRNP